MIERRVPRVLLVEDNENDEVLTLHALRTAGVACDIDVVRDGVQAVEYLCGEGRGDPPALVLLDLNVPKVDGHAILQRVRAQESTRHVPVVVLTSSREAQDVIRAYRLGANSYVCKPIDFDHFQKCARLILLHWLELNVAPSPDRG